jgi:hypothetical protein
MTDVAIMLALRTVERWTNVTERAQPVSMCAAYSYEASRRSSAGNDADSLTFDMPLTLQSRLA